METIIAAVISGVLSLIAGFAGGYFLGINNSKHQKQLAGKCSTQFQVGEIKNEKHTNSR